MDKQRERKPFELWRAYKQSIGDATMAVLGTPIVHLKGMERGVIKLPTTVTLRDGSVLEVNQVSVNVNDGDRVIVARFDGIKG